MSHEEVLRYIARAEQAIKVAEDLMKTGHVSDAASKIYYAMFYASQALLKSAGIEVTKHSAVEAAIGLHFAKAGKMEPRHHRTLIDARKIREIADYGITDEVIEPVATLKIEEGKEYLGVVKKLLGM